MLITVTRFQTLEPNQEPSMSILYKTTVTASGGRDGRAVSTDGNLDVALSLPKELGGAGGKATNPEQLFAAGYSACFLSALKLVAGKAGVRLPPDAAVSADVGIGPNGSGFALAADLRVALPGVAREHAEMLVEKAHQVCPYSNATRGNLDVQISIV
jgi:osmotically inducible protein OsmC